MASDCCSCKMLLDAFRPTSPPAPEFVRFQQHLELLIRGMLTGGALKIPHSAAAGRSQRAARHPARVVQADRHAGRLI